MLTVYTQWMRMKLGTLVKSEKGQGLVEYALIIALVAIVLVGSLTTLNGNIAAAFTKIGAALTAAVGS